MVKITYDEFGRAISVETDFWDGFIGNEVDETKDSYIIRKHGVFGLGAGAKRIMKSRFTSSVNKTIIDKREDAKITIGGKNYTLNDLPDELKKRLGL